MITDDDIRRVVPARSFAAGLRYHLDGRVQELSVEADGTTIKALVLRSGIDRRRPGDVVLLAFNGRYALISDVRLLILIASKWTLPRLSKFIFSRFFGRRPAFMHRWPAAVP